MVRKALNIWFLRNMYYKRECKNFKALGEKRMDMRAGIIFLAAIVVASGCIHASTTDDTSSQEPDSVDTGEQQNNTVFYTDSGFQPSTLEIQQGETVTWLDRSSQPMWVASNRHPIHADYDGTSLNQHCNNGQSDTFDQCSSGERYSFTFDKTGEWSYHNHRFQAHGGTVVVN